jgi:hypothetical protein
MSRAQQRRHRNRGPPYLPPPPPPPPRPTKPPPEPEQPQPAPVFFGPHIARGRRSQAYSRERKLKTMLRVPEIRVMQKYSTLYFRPCTKTFFFSYTKRI